MPITENQKNARKKYLSEKIDHINFRVPRGEKEILREHAETHGESLNGFIYRAVTEAMARDKKSES